MKLLTFFLAALLLCAPVYAAPPTGVQASYEVFSGGLKVGQMNEIYRRNGDHYTLTSTTTPVGLLAMFKPEKIFFTSSGLITKQGLRPLNFEDKREGNPARSSQAEFDWATQQLTLIRQSQRTPLALPEGTQDRLSAMYQFMFLKNDSTLDFSMTNGNKLDTYHYAAGAQQKVDTPAGQFDSLYLDSQPKEGESRTEIWLETKNHLPCKMVITDASGDQLIQILSALIVQP
ncbi:MAG TPA: hypothetical protein DE312_00220 [Gallionella sp.]|jgi:hypothetical protein|nr:DUF3108 domain-containing protein [Gallionella sp.]OGS66985.1 MAG: hypothetical protein A2Z87_01925 [Gallionellales bacterium GWA2_54_124]OGT19474.1 MAG: hypothetical protein A2522_03470 [Gallionellales bacterium RIFOXYD12_FULL_53_10]HCI51752.1 hypothetical protein [Gallionella sp.]